ncbi:MAG: hypothetical protein ACR2NW_10445 [Thermodesulfobacteriota bacterium]
MDLLTREELSLLINQKKELSISIYLPTFIRGTDTLQNQTKFKNLIKHIKQEYIDDEYANFELHKLLKETRKFFDNYEFWQHQSECLAMFLSKDFFKYYRLPFKFDEFFCVRKNFYIIPLISYLNSVVDYYILYLSQKEISLYSSENLEFNKVNIEELNKITGEELNNREFQKQLQFFTGAGAGSRKDSMFFGTGAKDLQIHKHLLNFFNKVDRSIRKNLIDKRPLILAGADYIFPIYKQANSYPWILEEVIHGNPKDLNRKELIKRACDILKKHRRKQVENEYAKLIELKNTDQSKYSRDLEVVINASYYGKIDELFILSNKKIWGKYNEKRNKIELIDNPDSDTDELLNIAAINTLANGGDVYILDCDENKHEKPVAARFRY